MLVKDPVILSNVCRFNWAAIVEQFDDAEVLGLAECLQEHKARDFVRLNVKPLHLHDGLWKRDGACLEYIKG